jgi:hypothetical protein
MIIRKSFPPVYRHVHPKTGATYFQVCVRRDGQNYRKTFSTEEPALDHARQLAEQFQRHGIQPEVPHEDKLRADAYQKLVERLTPYGKTPEEGIARCLETLADDAINQAKPTVGKLVDQFQAHKLLEKVDEQYRNEIKVHCKFIKRTWGDRRIDDLRKNEVETTLTKSHTNKNTRRKYLTFVRMFFNWVQGEDKGYVLTNPTTGIRFKADSFEKEFYPPEAVKRLLGFVAGPLAVILRV